MLEYRPNLIWYSMVLPDEKSEPFAAKRTAPVPIGRWEDISSHNGDEVFFFGENDSGEGLIKTRANIYISDGCPFVAFGSEIYELKMGALKSYRKFVRTEAVPGPILYDIELFSYDEEEKNLFVVTGDNCICDIELANSEVENLDTELKKAVNFRREFWLLVPKLKTP